MKRLLTILFLIIFSFVISGYSYHQKCRECQRERKENKTVMCEIGTAWRDFGTPIIHKDAHAYATYRCCYGHSYLVDLSE